MTNRNNPSSPAAIHLDSSLHVGLLVGGVATLSYLAARLGGALVIRPEMIWPFWPGCAFLVAVLLLTPRKIWPAVLLAGIAGFAVYDVQEALPLRATTYLLVADSVEISVAALGVNYVFGGAPRLSSVKALMKYALFAAILAPVSVASAAAKALEGDSWWVGFFTEALALLTLTPAILGWVDIALTRAKKPHAHYVEALLLWVGLATVGYFTFVMGAQSRPAMLYSLVPFLLWAALRFGITGASSSLVLVAFLGTIGVVHKRGPFAGGMPVNDVLSLQLFLLVAGTSFMLLAAVVEGRKAAEQSVRESENRFRLAQQVARIGTFERNVRTGVNTWTAEMESMYGLPPGGFAGTRTAFENLVHPEDLVETKRLVDEALRTGRPTAGEWRVIWPDGSVHWIAGRWQLLEDEFGEPLRVVGANIDITERKRAEEAIKENEARFRLVADTAPVMIWMSGPDKKTTYFNKLWLDFTGFSEIELHHRLTEIVHPEDYQQCHDVYCRGFDQRQPFKKECRLRRQDGQYRWMLDNGVPRFYKDGSFAGYIGSCIDVTEQKIAQEAMSGMTRNLVKAQEQERARIARELHDDINQRLAMLVVELEQLQDDPVEVRIRVQELQHQTTEISNGLHALAHDLHPPQLEYLGIAAAMKSWCKEFGARQGMEIDCRHQVRSTLPPDIGLCLFRVLQEALHNAAKHSGVKRIEVELIEDSSEIHLTIRDLGKGFDIETARQARGLGLTSMQERVRLVNGTIDIQSKPMGGTRILVRVPLELGREAQRAAG